MIHKLSRATIKLLFLYSLLAFFHDLALADPPYQLCSNASDNTAYTTSFQNNLNDLFISLVSNASAVKFYNTFIGNDSHRVYGLYMCLNFISNEHCQSCIADAKQDIVNLCPNKTEAVVWEEYCQLRYSNEDFFGQLDVTGNVLLDNVLNISEPEHYRSFVNNTLSNPNVLKPSNVLLDSSFNPKISDFGMARIITGCLGEINTATIVGTCGYMAPEYAMQGVYSIKSDVYSFGVVLLEVITGRSNAGFHKSKRAPSLTAVILYPLHPAV